MSRAPWPGSPQGRLNWQIRGLLAAGLSDSARIAEDLAALAGAASPWWQVQDVEEWDLDFQQVADWVEGTAMQGAVVLGAPAAVLRGEQSTCQVGEMGEYGILADHEGATWHAELGCHVEAAPLPRCPVCQAVDIDEGWCVCRECGYDGLTDPTVEVERERRAAFAEAKSERHATAKRRSRERWEARQRKACLV